MDEPNKKFLILIVEDERILADTLTEKLDTEKFDVIESFNGLDGLEFALKRHPDLILLDILMPKMDGFEVIKKLSEDPWGVNAKVIVLTNVSDPGDMVAQNSFAGLGKNYEYLTKANTSLDEVVLRIKHKLGIKI
ncbi:MAG: response regulator [Candidatus Paceibacterota bacterium]|jgi:CheY-like chemotaxis protein